MMSFGQTEWVWMNGKYVRWNDATVHLTTHTLHLGSGVFEAIRCYRTERGPAVFRMDAHLDRLFYSAGIYQMEIPYTRDELGEAVCGLIRQNGFDICYVRLLVYFGSGSLGVLPKGCPVEVALVTWPLGAYLGAEGLEQGVRVTISRWVKFHSRMMPTTAKACGQYLNSLLAVREAVGKGFDEAILLDEENNIAEGSGENIFIVREGELLTNDEESSILLGVTRDAVIEIARDLGLQVHIRKLKLEDLLTADEAFFTGTAAEVTPIREVDGQMIGSSPRGPMTEQLQRVFFAATSGQEPKYAKWLRLVNSLAA
jgi:branched-chain amino acid aminotransferase